MNLNFLWWIGYFLCVVYCMWRLFKRYKKTSHDGVIGVTPGLDLIAVIFLAPILTIVDIVVSWVMMVNTYYKNK